MIFLGIETSCDETAAAVARLHENKITVLSNVVSSQINIHKKYGGVVPEVAAREHVLNIIPVIDQALKEASASPQELGGIAATRGPGLITSLLTGWETARTLSYAWGKPLIGVNHIAGHIAANFISENGSLPVSGFKFPAVILTVSGGHTMLIKSPEIGSYKTIGETRDDAAGEAFDKAAQLMGLGYPGGPAISREAGKTEAESVEGAAISLPRPMIDSADLDFSFSGLKTALRYALENDPKWPSCIPKYCREFQQAVIDVLTAKTLKAAQKTQAKSIMLAGGVAANHALRNRLQEAACSANLSFYMPELKYTTDNAAMIAAAGLLKARGRKIVSEQRSAVECNLEL